MNLLLLFPEELSTDGLARLRGRRALHAREVLDAAPGRALAAGVLGGRLGTAEVLSSSGDELVVRATLDRAPPPRSPVDLLLALPRPKVLRRVLQAAASMGIGRVVLLGSWKVEKSYWSSPALEPGAIRDELVLGLEQGRDTILPEVAVRRLFKPFVEDELDAVFPAGVRLLAHNAAAETLVSRRCAGARGRRDRARGRLDALRGAAPRGARVHGFFTWRPRAACRRGRGLRRRPGRALAARRRRRRCVASGA